MTKAKNTNRTVLYARFSSHLQREESIDAQIRAMREYADRHNLEVIGEYIDRAKSATTDQRPQFQQMITDCKAGLFDYILVHKLDRFSRDRYDSVRYKQIIKRNGVILRSVSENLDGSPESIITESILEGFAEYYSKNLAREVEKGKRENALKAKHVGGTPPLGYDVDRTTMKLVINPHEAEAVRLIFDMYLKRQTYGEIIEELARRGLKTKRGTAFVRTSLHSILKNPKYTGLYTYSRSAAKNVDGKRNGHRYKDDSEIIKVENGLPALVTETQFNLVQEIMADNRLKSQPYTRFQYLLSGLISCGSCGYSMVGNYKHARESHPTYVNYVCNNRDKKVPCEQYGIRREVVESIVLQQQADLIFDETKIPELIDGYNSFRRQQNMDWQRVQSEYQLRLTDIQKEMDNIIRAVGQTGSDVLVHRLNELDLLRKDLQSQLKKSDQELRIKELGQDAFRSRFTKARELFANGQLLTTRLLISRFVQQVWVFPDRIEIKFNLNITERMVILEPEHTDL